MRLRRAAPVVDTADDSTDGARFSAFGGRLAMLPHSSHPFTHQPLFTQLARTAHATHHNHHKRLPPSHPANTQPLSNPATTVGQPQTVLQPPHSRSSPAFQPPCLRSSASTQGTATVGNANTNPTTTQPLFTHHSFNTHHPANSTT